MVLNFKSKKCFAITVIGVILAVLIATIVVLTTSSSGPKTETYKFENSDVELRLEPDPKNTGGYDFTIFRDGTKIQYIKFLNNIRLTRIVKHFRGLKLIGYEQEIEIINAEDTSDFSLITVQRKLKKGQEAKDGIQTYEYLSKKEVQWYGGPEQMEQLWPIQKLRFDDYAYVPKELNSAAVMERYWFNSEGVFFYVDKEVPLFIDQTTDFLILKAKKALPYYTYDNSFVFKYNIGISSNAREAHMQAVDRFLGKPKNIPDEKMIRHPIWSTWVRYGRPINQQTILNFAEEINTNGFKNSQLAIDDFWETCYGSMKINPVTFTNMTELTSKLHNMGFRVTLWIHPFINRNCEPWYTIANTKNFLVKSYNASIGINTKWWNSGQDEAAYLNFNNEKAVEWFKNRLQELKNEYGVDSFKFDAGESSWSPEDPILDGPTELSPASLTVNYVRMCSEFGKMIEIRTGWGTQELPVFVRMLDKDTRWNCNNGLQTLITTLLQMNLNGYPFVLPDMIGGNVYGNDILTKEIFIRWLQANTFMPTMQFSKTPWDIDDETVKLSLKFTQLHEKYSDFIIERFKLAVTNGDPVNPPIWWIDPEDEQALKIDDEFLLGDDILVAPVIKEFASSRNVYLPKGIWTDGNTETIYIGPRWIADYSAGLDILPYFIKDTFKMGNKKL